MEQFIREIEDYCAAAGIAPEAVLRRSINASNRQWGQWRDGAASPTMATADRVRAWMRANPPVAAVAGGEAA